MLSLFPEWETKICFARVDLAGSGASEPKPYVGVAVIGPHVPGIGVSIIPADQARFPLSTMIDERWGVVTVGLQQKSQLQ